MRPPDWQSDDGAIQLYCGDCLELLPEMEAGCVDAVVTDPPYGVTKEIWDRDPDQQDLDVCLRIASGPVGWFGAASVRQQRTILALCPPPERAFVWWNPFTRTHSAGGFWQWQPLWVWRINGVPAVGADVWRHAANDPQHCHPTQKPVSLMKDVVVTLTTTEQLVLDPYMGSGTTAVACVKLGRKCIGIEIEPKYFEIAVKRVKAAIQQGPDDALFTQVDKPRQLPLSGTETS